MATTHLAGGFIQIGPRAIQRCMVCGEKLTDFDVRNIAVPEGMSSEAGRWETGALVEVEGPRSSLVGMLEEDFEVKDLPVNFCLVLVEVGR